MRDFKKNKGITLIALVITIIVLLILAGVSLSLVMGNEGILGRATSTVDKTEISKAKEEAELLIADLGVEFYEKKYMDKQEKVGEIDDYIKEKFGSSGQNTSGGYFLTITDKIVKLKGAGRTIATGVLEQGAIKWDKEKIISEDERLLEEVNANPDNYRNLEQKNSTAIGIGANGEAVNMDLWLYQYEEEGKSYKLCNEEITEDGKVQEKKAYLGSDYENIVIPQYIKTETDEEFKPVVSLRSTFRDCTELVTVSKIPNMVANMAGTFWNCTSLTTAPEIPNRVTDMTGTFWNCTSLITAPEIPSSVTMLGATFWNCTSLTTAPEIPNSVTYMRATFQNCTNLVTAPELPSFVSDIGGIFFRMYKTYRSC